MIFPDLQLVDDNPSWSLVLGAYRALELEAAEARVAERKKAKAAAQDASEADTETDDEVSEPAAAVADDRWMPRQFDIDGVTNEELSGIHGQLIAYGFLNFELSNRDGLVYQLTNLGKRAVIAPEDRPSVDEDREPLPQAA